LSCEDVVAVVDLWRRRNLLSAEVHTELDLLVPVTTTVDVKLPALPVIIHPEPRQGNSGFVTFQNWLHQYQLYARHNLKCCGTAADSCSVGVSAAKLQGEPSEFVMYDVNKQATGVQYLGLPDDNTYRYYGVYFSEQADGSRAPPQIWYGEAAHLARTFRCNIATKREPLDVVSVHEEGYMYNKRCKNRVF
jgi:hypothetical protein